MNYKINSMYLKICFLLIYGKNVYDFDGEES